MGWERDPAGAAARATASRQHRDTTDWRGLYDEGMRVELGGGELGEGAVLVAPFTRERALVVLMVPVPQALLGTVRATLEQVAQLVRGAGGLLQLLAQGSLR